MEGIVTEQETGRMVRTFGGAMHASDMERVEAVVEHEMLPALRQPGNTHVFACVGPVSPETSLVEVFLFTAWESREAMERVLGHPAIDVALAKLLGYVRAAPSLQTYELRALPEEGGAPAPATTTTTTDWVDGMWGTVQAELRTHSYRFEDNPYVRWFMLNSGDLPDFVAAARQHDPELVERLLARYREVGRNGLDDLEPGVIRPHSRTAQHLYYLLRVISRFGDLPDAAVLDIGGGFGNLARMLVQLDACATCDLVDIEGVTGLQEEYLQASLPSGRRRYRLFNIQDDADRAALADREYDLVISMFALSETPAPMRDWYIDNVLLRARHLYIVGNEVWRDENVFQQLRERLGGTFTCEQQPFVWQSPHSSAPYLELFASRAPSDGA